MARKKIGLYNGHWSAHFTFEFFSKTSIRIINTLFTQCIFHLYLPGTVLDIFSTLSEELDPFVPELNWK
jgi:hypothetical protein